MLSFVQLLLEVSMILHGKKNVFLRIVGTLTGIFPVWYCRHMEKKLFQGKWHPAGKYRKKRNRKQKRKCLR